MKDQEIRIAIAEACGWTKHLITSDVYKCDRCGIEYNRMFWAPWEVANGWCRKDGKEYPPDYLNDLNAMHEAILTLLGTCKYDQFMEELSKGNTWAGTVNATARQRAIAFVRTIGKLKEGEQA